MRLGFFLSVLVALSLLGAVGVAVDIPSLLGGGEGQPEGPQTHYQFPPLDPKECMEDEDIDPRIKFWLCPVKAQAQVQFGINFYLNPMLSASGINLKGEDVVCEGDTITLSDDSISGEWIIKGALTDTPPVEFREDMENVYKGLENGSYVPNLHVTHMQSMGGVKGPPSGSYTGATLCSRGCTVRNSDKLEAVSEKAYRASGEGEADFEITCEPRCMVVLGDEDGRIFMYGFAKFDAEVWEEKQEEARDEMDEWIERALGGDPTAFNLSEGELAGMFQIPIEAMDSLGPVTKSFTLQVLESPGEPKVEVTAIHMPEEAKIGSRFIIRLEIANRGDSELFMEGVKVNVKEYRVLYKPEFLGPGEDSEILVEMISEEKEIKAVIEYSSETSECLGTRSFSESVGLGVMGGESIDSCSGDYDCDIGKVCCAGVCRDSRSGVCDDIDGDGEPETWVEV